MLASPRPMIHFRTERIMGSFNPTQDACFPTTEGEIAFNIVVVDVSILLRMLASPRLWRAPLPGPASTSFNPTQDACFPTTLAGKVEQDGDGTFQSYSGCLLPHDAAVRRGARAPRVSFNPTQDACFPTTVFVMSL